MERVGGEVKESQTEARMPIVAALRTYPKQILLAAGAFLVINAYFYILVSYLINYATAEAGTTNSTILTIVLISSVVSFFAIPYFAGLSDRFGRRPLYLVGMGVSAFLLFSRPPSPCTWRCSLRSPSSALTWRRRPTGST